MQRRRRVTFENGSRAGGAVCEHRKDSNLARDPRRRDWHRAVDFRVRHIGVQRGHRVGVTRVLPQHTRNAQPQIEIGARNHNRRRRARRPARRKDARDDRLRCVRKVELGRRVLNPVQQQPHRRIRQTEHERGAQTHGRNVPPRPRAACTNPHVPRAERPPRRQHQVGNENALARAHIEHAGGTLHADAHPLCPLQRRADRPRDERCPNVAHLDHQRGRAVAQAHRQALGGTLATKGLILFRERTVAKGKGGVGVRDRTRRLVSIANVTDGIVGLSWQHVQPRDVKVEQLRRSARKGQRERAGHALADSGEADDGMHMGGAATKRRLPESVPAASMRVRRGVAE